MKLAKLLLLLLFLGFLINLSTPVLSVFAATPHCNTALDCSYDNTMAGCTCNTSGVCTCKIGDKIIDDNDPYCDKGKPESGYKTAFGCIKTTTNTTDENSFYYTLLRVAIGIAGGISLILMLYGTFIVTTSAGLPDKLTLGKDIITSAITGLLFIILSVVIFNFIGIKILALPGLV